MATEQSLRLIRLPEVISRVGLSKPSLYRLMKKNKFPKSIPLSDRTVAWENSEVSLWINERIAEARNGGCNG